MRKKETEKKRREEFEAFLAKTAIGREYFEEIEDTIKDLRASSGKFNPSAEQKDIGQKSQES